MGNQHDHTNPRSIQLQDVAMICTCAYYPGKVNPSLLPGDFIVLTAHKRRWKFFYSRTSRTCVIAFKGTEIGDSEDLIANIHVLAGVFKDSSGLTRTLRDIKDYVRYTLASYEVSHIIFTGHSLGSRYAVAAYNAHVQYSDVIASCICFNTLTAPADIRDGLHSDVPPPDTPVRILHVCVHGDVVSSWNQQLDGHVWMLPPENKDEHILERHNMMRMIKRVEDAKLPWAMPTRINQTGQTRSIPFLRNLLSSVRRTRIPPLCSSVPEKFSGTLSMRLR